MKFVSQIVLADEGPSALAMCVRMPRQTSTCARLKTEDILTPKAWAISAVTFQLSTTYPIMLSFPYTEAAFFQHTWYFQRTGSLKA